MGNRYISEVVGGARRFPRMLPGDGEKSEYRRQGAQPGSGGHPRCEFQTAWIMEHAAGYWQSIDIPEMVARISRSAWQTDLRPQRRALRAAGDSTDPAVAAHAKTDDYPDGTPIRPGEIEDARNSHPRSLGVGEFLRWGLLPIPVAEIPNAIALLGNTRRSQCADYIPSLKYSFAPRRS